MNKIPVNQPVISTEARHFVSQALETGWLSSAGPFVTQFEEAFAAYLGVKHAIAVSNGTAALHTALLAVGIGKGDEVIVPAFTMGATWLAVLYTGAIPVFVDAELETYNINPELIEAKITTKTKAIIPVHIYGHPADMNPIMAIAQKHKLIVIEDAAESHGATYKQKKTGSMGDINCFSFYANKIITTGEGGMVVTDDDFLAAEARKFRDLYHSEKKRFIHEKIGFNYRLTNLQAAVGLGELQHIDEYVSKKQNMARKYAQLLSKVPGIKTPVTKQYATNVFWMYGITVDESKFGLSKDVLRAKLLEKGIDTRDFFYAPEDQPVLRPYLKKNEHYPVTNQIAQTGLYLPSGLAITDDQITRVAQAIASLCGKK